MPTVTRYPTSDTAVSGTWSNPTNVQADDGAVASATPAIKNTTWERAQGGYGFDAQIPSNAVIDNVFLEVEWRTVSPGISFLGVTAVVLGTPDAYQENSSEPTVLTEEIYDVTASRSWTRANLLDANFGTRLEARTGNNTGGTYEYDYVRVRVVYTVPPPTITGGTAADAGRDFAAPFQDITINWTEAVEHLGAAYTAGDTIAGLTVSLAGGAEQAVTYRSGEGTATWVVRVAQLVQNGQTIQFDYVQAAGDIFNVGETQEAAAMTNVSVTNNLTKRIREILKRGDTEAAITTAVDIAILDAEPRDSDDAAWMAVLQRHPNVTPSAAGLIDLEATEASLAVGDPIYLAVFNPREDATTASTYARTALAATIVR